MAIIPPPPDIQPVIDKLAEYVARNGLKFETSVRAKNDQRFEFLQPWHQYNAYYEFKKQFFLQKEGGSSTQVCAEGGGVEAWSSDDRCRRDFLFTLRSTLSDLSLQEVYCLGSVEAPTHLCLGGRLSSPACSQQKPLLLQASETYLTVLKRRVEHGLM